MREIWEKKKKKKRAETHPMFSAVAKPRAHASAWRLGLIVQAPGFGIYGSGSGFRIWNVKLGFRVQGLAYMVRVEGSRFGIYG